MQIYSVALLSTLALISSTYCKCDVNGGGDKAAIDVDCNGKGDHVECVARSTGNAAGKGCFNLVAGCPDGPHSTHVCSAVIAAGKQDTIQVPLANFKPALHGDCKKLSVEHLVVTGH